MGDCKHDGGTYTKNGQKNVKTKTVRKQDDKGRWYETDVFDGYMVEKITCCSQCHRSIGDANWVHES